jgi:hypothetical protein
VSLDPIVEKRSPALSDAAAYTASRIAHWEQVAPSAGCSANQSRTRSAERRCFGAAKLGLEIVELPIRYRERTYGTTNIQRWRHGWLLLKMCVFAAGRIKFV